MVYYSLRLLVQNCPCARALAHARGEETLNTLVQKYENIVGLTEIKDAQNKVIRAESNFISVQQQRQSKQTQLLAVQQRLKALSYELEKLQRTDDRYLALITEEHRIIKEEDLLHKEMEQLEESERQQFSLMSIALRDSHEKERAQSERTKYWSIGGSCLGAAIGFIGSTINNRIKMKQLRQLFEVNSEQSSSELSQKLVNINDSITKVTESVEHQSLNFNSNNNENLAHNNDYDMGGNVLDRGGNVLDNNDYDRGGNVLDKLEQHLIIMENRADRNFVTGMAVTSVVLIGSVVFIFLTR